MPGSRKPRVCASSRISWAFSTACGTGSSSCDINCCLVAASWYRYRGAAGSKTSAMLKLLLLLQDGVRRQVLTSAQKHDDASDHREPTASCVRTFKSHHRDNNNTVDVIHHVGAHKTSDARNGSSSS
eukprot:2660-Heterococcus_DN1.PRE.1